MKIAVFVASVLASTAVQAGELMYDGHLLNQNCETNRAAESVCSGLARYEDG